MYCYIEFSRSDVSRYCYWETVLEGKTDTDTYRHSDPAKTTRWVAPAIRVSCWWYEDLNKIIKLCSDPQPVQPVLVLAHHLQHCHQAGLTFSPSYRLNDMKVTESEPLTYITCDQKKLARSSRVSLLIVMMSGCGCTPGRRGTPQSPPGGWQSAPRTLLVRWGWEIWKFWLMYPSLHSLHHTFHNPAFCFLHPTVKTTVSLSDLPKLHPPPCRQRRWSRCRGKNVIKRSLGWGFQTVKVWGKNMEEKITGNSRCDKITNLLIMIGRYNLSNKKGDISTV